MATSPSSEDHSLPKHRILRGQKNFSRLFVGKGVKVFHGNVLSFRFRLYPDKPGQGCKVGFIVKRTLGKATVRNRVKRLMREAYRKQQHRLCDYVDDKTAGFHGVLMAKTIDIEYQDAADDVQYLLDKTLQFIHSLNIVN